jgi:hypothetical protein
MKHLVYRTAAALLFVAATTAPSYAQWTTSSGNVVLSPDAKVVVGPAGVASPQAPLNIVGSDVSGSYLGRKIDLYPDATAAPYGLGLFGDAWTSLYANAGFSGAGISLGFYTNGAATPYASKLMVKPNGRVGIGTPDPKLLLHIFDPASAFALLDRGTTSGNSGIVLRTNNDGGTQWLIGQNGGDTTGKIIFAYPAFAYPKLTVDTSGNVTATGALTGGSISTTGSIGGGSISTTGSVTGGSISTTGSVTGGSISTTGSVTGGSITSTGAITASGNITTSGNISTTGSISGATVIGAVYQDLAEWVPASDDLAPGTVVVLDPSHDNQVRSSSQAYDTSVAGVVSANPGLLLGKEGASKEKVATTGRVKVHVDATQGAVKIGDLLVTSDRAGFAMKSQPMTINGRKFHQPGTLIGKALEPLDGGTGDILVLLSLQ